MSLSTRLRYAPPVSLLQAILSFAVLIAWAYLLAEISLWFELHGSSRQIPGLAQLMFGVVFLLTSLVGFFCFFWVRRLLLPLIAWGHWLLNKQRFLSPDLVINNEGSGIWTLHQSWSVFVTSIEDRKNFGAPNHLALIRKIKRQGVPGVSRLIVPGGFVSDRVMMWFGFTLQATKGVTLYHRIWSRLCSCETEDRRRISGARQERHLNDPAYAHDGILECSVQHTSET